MSITKGTIVKIKEQWQDDGDSEIIFIALSGESKGRIDIMPINVSDSILPTYIVRSEMVYSVTTESILSNEIIKKISDAIGCN